MNQTAWRPILLTFTLLCGVPKAQAAPSFTLVPAASTNMVGSSVKMTLYQDGQPAVDPTGYQWRFNGRTLADNSRISGSQTSSLTISNLNFPDTGSYILGFTAQVGTNLSKLSVTGMVYVIDMPAIVGDLTTQTRGADVTFTVTATGGLLSYQWRWQGADLPGATASTLQFTNAYVMANGGYYNVRVSNPANPTGITAATSLLFVKPTPNGNYQGLFYPDDNVTPESTGFFQASLTSSKRTFSGKLVIGTQKYPFSGVFLADSTAQVQVQRKNDSPLTLTMQLLTTNNLPQITGHVEASAWTSTLNADLIAFYGAAASPLQGRYTLALVNANTSPSVPNGDCCATFNVGKNGNLSMTGKVADGSSISQSAALSASGDWPLYVSLNKGRGRLAGWVKVQRQTSGSIQGGPVAWVKSAGPDALYPDGFGLLLQPVGSTFTQPVTNSILNFTNGVVALYGGDLFAGNDPAWSFIRVSLTPTTKFTAEMTPEGFQVTAKAATGWMEGKFKDMVTGKRVPVWGVALQQQSMARGFFTSTNAAGAFAISPIR